MVSSNEMTQQPQDEFETSMENAEAWMKAIQDRLRVNDNTQGPRSALEARLRETENICELEPEGRFKMDLVLMKAEALLRDSSEEEKHEIQAKLKYIKALYEETSTYMTHCHSRIEWVWLHWSEYLKARDEFAFWLHNMRLTLEPDVELQLGLKEKQWQHSHAQILLKDVHNQAALLERLLEEAAALYNRIGDPSVDEDVQSKMKGEYEGIKKKAQERVRLLAKIMAEHTQYQEHVDQFRRWLNDVIEKLKHCVGRTTEPTESRLNIFQDIANDVKSGDQKLEQLDLQSALVISHTSPLGAENIKTELEELRKALGELKVMNDEEMEALMKIHQSESAYLVLAKQLEADIRDFRKLIRSLESSLETEERVKTEEELIALWRKYMATRSTLATEESRVEKLKLQLKELFRFSQDVQDPSNSVVSTIREYQSVKSKAFKLCTETESGLRQCFQNPLREFHHWKPAAQQVLDTTADMTDLPMIQTFSMQIETLLEESLRLRERMMMMQLKKDFIRSIFGEEKADSLLNEAAQASKEREALHNSLLQRKRSFQISVSKNEGFDISFEPLQTRLHAIAIKVATENELQPDLVGKESKLQRLQMLHEELETLAPQIEELESGVHHSTEHKHKINQLSSEVLALKRSLEVMIQSSRQHANDHRKLNNTILDLQSWIMEMHQELKSFQDVNGKWGIEDRESDVERLLDGFPEKELQMHQVETQGHRVLENSSFEGATLVQSELKQLNTTWTSLLHLAEALSRVHKGQFRLIEMDSDKKITGLKRQDVSKLLFFKDNTDANGKDMTIGRAEEPAGLNSPSDQIRGTRKTVAAGEKEQGTKLTSSNDNMYGTGQIVSLGTKEHMSSFTAYRKDTDEPGKTRTGGRSERGIRLLSSSNNMEGNGKRMTFEKSRIGSGLSSSSENNDGTGKIMTVYRSEERAGSIPCRDSSDTSGVNMTGGHSQQGLEVYYSTYGIDGPGAEITVGKSEQITDIGSFSENERDTPYSTINSGGRKWTIGFTPHHGTEISTKGSQAAMGLSFSPDGDINLLDNQTFITGGNSPFGFTHETEAAGKSRSTAGDKHGSGLTASRQVKWTKRGEDIDSAGSKWNTKLHDLLEDETTVSGKDIGPVGGENATELSFFNIHEMSVLEGKMGKGGRKQSGHSSHTECDVGSVGRISLIGGKPTTGLMSYSEVEQTIPDANMPEPGGKWTVTIPTDHAKRIAGVSKRVTGAEKPPVLEVKGITDYNRLIKEFEEWLRVENIKLNKILTSRTTNSDEDIDTRRQKLLVLQSRIPEGQHLFEALRLYRPAMGITEDLRMEDLRYHWMLYKSKLKDSGSILALKTVEEPARLQKKTLGICAFLYRVCRAALPLQLLLLLLLLLAFLLPLAEEHHSCSLANNFARSFSLMLRYEKPPPT
ncbi:nesprin-3 isoform X2 [Ambystoma mexicanum]|uniref:nesprin-3 isoform X2 n=1 Tax=Ambystoma mexicanum TaxID=8296 RepID=UPI0037E78683